MSGLVGGLSAGLEAELLADRAAAESCATDDDPESLARAQAWMREYARNNGTPTKVTRLAIDYLAQMEQEGWGM